MSGTPEAHLEKVRAYYAETTEKSYLTSWSGQSLGFHMGLADETTPSLEASLLAMNAFVADRAGITKGMRVLDAGCGVGGSSIWIAKERGANVVGITIEPGQVELARKFAEERGLSDVTRFECMDYVATTFEHASFDVVWNLESICHASDPRDYLTHVRTLLRPGGHFACADFFVGDGGDPAERKAMCDGWFLPSLKSAQDLASILRELEFVDVDVVDLTPRVQLSAAALRGMAERRAFALRVEREMAGIEAPIYEGHVRAAIGAVDGLRSGSITYAYVGARRP